MFNKKLRNLFLEYLPENSITIKELDSIIKRMNIYDPDKKEF